MKITYLLMTADAGAGTENAVITQANGMADHADVEVLSVHRTARRPHFPVAKRARLTYIAGAPKERTPSLVIPDSWDNQFDATTDPLIERELRRLRTDILVTTTPALAYLAARFAPPRVKIVHQEHRASFLRGRGFEPVRLAAPRLSRITALSEITATWLKRELPGEESRVIVVPNAIDVAGALVSDRREKLIVTAGRLVPAKQFEHVVHAFARTREDHPGWQLRVYGDGPSRSSLQTVIRRHGLETSVSLPGVVPDLPTALAQASVFALASRSEAFSLVVAEAQAAGVPVVSYDTQVGPRDILTVTGGGIIVPMNSRSGLAAGMDYFMSSTEARDQYGERGREGSWTYDRTAVTAQWREVFHSVLAGPDTSRARLSAAPPAVDPQPAGEPQAATMSSGEVRRRIQDGLSDAGVAWRPGLSTGSIWRIATEQTNIRPVLDVLADETDDTILVTARLRRETVADSWRATAEPPILASAADELILTQPNGQRLGSIELWSRTPEGLYSRPGPPIGPAWVDEPSWTSWLSAGTETASGKPYWSEATFPIDVVYTWVDGDDPSWRARRAPFMEQTVDATSDAVRDARFRNRDEIYYSISSVKRYMPWVNRIFIVTDRQVPARVLAEFPDVIVVDHHEIFPDPEVLPVFNSHAIEATLHRIPGLSEQYIYFNDDILVARPLPVDQFFLSNGIAKFFPQGVEINFGGNEDKPHMQAGSNNRRLILEDFGVEVIRGMMHTPHPQRKSVAEDLERAHPEEFARTRASRFRSPTDISVASSLVPYYGYLTGRFVPGAIGYRYASLRSDALSSRLQHILNDARVAVVALAEPMNEDRRHRDEEQILIQFLEELVHRGNPAPAMLLPASALEAAPPTGVLDAVGTDATGTEASPIIVPTTPAIAGTDSGATPASAGDVATEDTQ